MRVIGDSLFTILTMLDKWSKLAVPAGRKLLRDATEPAIKTIIQEQIALQFSSLKESMEAASEELAMVRSTASAHAERSRVQDTSHHRQALLHQMGPGKARSIIESAHQTIESQMLDGKTYE